MKVGTRTASAISHVPKREAAVVGVEPESMWAFLVEIVSIRKNSIVRDRYHDGLSVYVLPALMLAIAPLDALTKRLAFLMVGFAVLAALNQLYLYAPDIRGLLKPV